MADLVGKFNGAAMIELATFGCGVG